MVVGYTGGLPLALQVLGSFLYKRSQSEWRDMLDKMKKNNLHKDILKILHISFDGLEDDEYKTIFLDIACFFIKKPKSEVIRILKNCGLHPTLGIQVLMEKSLLGCSIQDFDSVERLHMHDLLQEMGRSIVLQESPYEAGRRSRLWSKEEIDQVMVNNKGSKKIQSICLEYHFLEYFFSNEAKWDQNCFSKMRNLRLLKLGYMPLFPSPNSLPSALKVLIWESYAPEVLPQINQLCELVELNLCNSKIKHLWNGRPFLGKLKYIYLSGSGHLSEMPDCSGIPNLESLFLDDCKSVSKIHDSVGQLQKLAALILEYCENLVSLPKKLELNSLKELNLFGCLKLEKLPDFGENMKSLSILSLGCTNITRVPSSITHLTNLQELHFTGGLCAVNTLFSSSDEVNAIYLSGLSSLVELNLCFSWFDNLTTPCIPRLSHLQRLNLSGCRRLQSIPELPPNLLYVDASHCPSIIIDVQRLFASLVSKNRKEIFIRAEVPDQIIPKWFKETECSLIKNDTAVSIIADIPCDVQREWLGIAMCFTLRFVGPLPASDPFWYYISFESSFNALEDEDEKETFDSNGVKWKNIEVCKIFLAFFPFNEENCQQYLRVKDGRIELSVKVKDLVQGGRTKIVNSGWRLICKEDFDVASSSLQIKELHNDK